MMRVYLIAVLSLFLAASVAVCFAGEEKGKAGEALFNEHCAMCHPNGGNIISPEKTLHKKNLEAHNLGKPENIVKYLRNPGPGMPSYDEKKLPDDAAKKIGEYILKTFR
ncbi:MAG: c-type cytochrome [Nitrospirota bacterium]